MCMTEVEYVESLDDRSLYAYWKRHGFSSYYYSKCRGLDDSRLENIKSKIESDGKTHDGVFGQLYEACLEELEDRGLYESHLYDDYDP